MENMPMLAGERREKTRTRLPSSSRAELGVFSSGLSWACPRVHGRSFARALSQEDGKQHDGQDAADLGENRRSESDSKEDCAHGRAADKGAGIAGGVHQSIGLTALALIQEIDGQRVSGDIL